MHSFENVPIQKNDAIPWEIDGNSIYQLKCNEDEFIDKQRDGRWWKMSESGRVDLNGRRKLGHARVPLYATTRIVQRSQQRV